MNSNTITIIVVTLLIALGAYWYFFTGTGNQPPLSATGATGNPAQMQFEALVSELQPISFSTDLFNDPRFTALVDLTTPIQPEAGGRPDPFAPVSPAAPAAAPATSPTGH
jgi:hypothetical protein